MASEPADLRGHVDAQLRKWVEEHNVTAPLECCQRAFGSLATRVEDLERTGVERNDLLGNLSQRVAILEEGLSAIRQMHADMNTGFQSLASAMATLVALSSK